MRPLEESKPAAFAPTFLAQAKNGDVLASLWFFAAESASRAVNFFAIPTETANVSESDLKATKDLLDCAASESPRNFSSTDSESHATGTAP